MAQKKRKHKKLLSVKKKVSPATLTVTENEILYMEQEETSASNDEQKSINDNVNVIEQGIDQFKIMSWKFYRDHHKKSADAIKFM